jgi:hypothetical protein
VPLAIRIEAPDRRRAGRLQQALEPFQARLVELDGQWEVHVSPDRAATVLLLELFEAIGAWLEESGLSSCRVRFGERSYTLVRPSEGKPQDAVEFLLERTIQLQGALESRIMVEQAKGVLAALLDVEIDAAFELLRRAARNHGVNLHDLAARLVAERELPAEVRGVLEQEPWRAGRRGSGHSTEQRADG